MSRIKRTGIFVAAFLMAVLLFVTAIFSYAYFSKKEIYDGYVSGQIELLFDRLGETGLQNYATAEGVAADSSAEWGSKENPYVISDVRHLYNLSELQNLGYFYKKHLSQNTADDFSHIPYFLVCTPDYAPVVIDGSSFHGITSIGSNEYPFIGSVNGVSGAAVTVNGRTTTTSVIHKVSVSGDPANTDVGLFGYVGFLGTPPAEGDAETSFTGMPSEISNLVLSDVSIHVESSLWGEVVEFVEDIAIGAGGHRYSFTDLYGTDKYDSVPHENHHIGILAGHVSYSKVEFISVFYSSEETVAIYLDDITTLEDGTAASYMSCTGILGFIYNLNPNYDEATGDITADSGVNITDLSYTTMIGGGGSLAGSKPGYVIAKLIYDAYHYIGGVEDTSGTINLKDATTEGGEPLCQEWIRTSYTGETEATGKYFFYDGVFTFALSTTSTSEDQDVIEPTWADDEAHKFSLGSTDRTQWITNYTKGNHAVAVYISKITSDSELQTALANNKPIVIMREEDAISYLMSLYVKSAVNDSDTFNQKYTTNGAGLGYGDQEFIDSILQSYEGMSADGMLDQFLMDFEVYGDGVVLEDKVDEIMTALENADPNWKTIDVGTSSSGMSIDDLRRQYKITGTKLAAHSFFDLSGTPLKAINEETEIEDFYDYNDTEYTGYFYYTEESIVGGLLGTQRKYYWQGKDGTSVTLREDSLFNTMSPADYFGDATGTWSGAEENIYTKTVNGTTYVGAVVNSTTGKFYSSGNTANANDIYLTKPSEDKVNFYYRPVGDTYFYYSVDNTKYAMADLVATGEYTIAGDQLYAPSTDASKTGILVDRYQTYSFSALDSADATNYLRMVKADFWNRGTHYTLWNGTDTQRDDYSNFKYGTFIDLNPDTVTDSIGATVKFNNDGTCTIQYSIDSVTQYVNFSGNTSNPGFNTALNASGANTKLCIFALEGSQRLDSGRVTFDPKIGEGIEFSADEHVLYATNDVNGDTVYEVINVEQLPNLGSEELGWNNGVGGVLNADSLKKKFHMQHGISFGLTVNTGDNSSWSTDGIITAPVGDNAVSANIPMSCVAFRINKEGEEKHIRVVVAVSTSEYYKGETDATGDVLNDLGDFTRYFALWQMPEAGAETFQMFNKDDYYERFEIPVSHPYDPATDSSDASSASGFYDNITYNGQQYGLYMNGDRLLVAYEFTVTDVGIYVLGPYGDADDAEVPMEIVYFAADGVASTGNDGENQSQIGTIDFVYENGSEIITVTEESSLDPDGNEDYSTFYPTYTLLYFKTATNNTDGTTTFHDVNCEIVKIRRYITTEDPPTSSDGYVTTICKSTIDLTVYDKGRTEIVQYGKFADNVKKTTVASPR